MKAAGIADPAAAGSGSNVAGSGRAQARPVPAEGRPSLVREIVAGGTVGIIALPLCVSAGVLAYEPLGQTFIAVGAATGILCAIAGGVVGALGRSSSFIPNIPSAPMALIQASFVATLMTALGGDPAVALAVMPLSVALAGLWQFVFAATGLARAVRFTPYPVVAGFVTGLAVLTVIQHAPRLFDQPSLARLFARTASAEPLPWAMALVGIVVVAAVRAAEHLAPRWPALLVGLVFGAAAWHGLAHLAPDLELGRTVGAVSLRSASVGFPIRPDALVSTLSDTKVLLPLLLTSLTLAILGTLDINFATRAAQNLCDIPARPRRDLAGQAASNVVSALVGGLAVTSSIGFAVTNYEAGGRTRLSGVAVALVLLGAALVLPRLIAALPLVVLSGVLLAIAWKMWDRWCLSLLRDATVATHHDARTRARRNIAIVAAVTGATVLGQPVVGALVGVGLACLVFIVEMSRPVIHSRTHAAATASKRIRSQAERTRLDALGRDVPVLELQGVLFFGNADDLATAIRAAEGGCRGIVLDLRRVTDLDTSGASVIRQVARRCSAGCIPLDIAAAGAKYRELLSEAVSDLPAVSLHADLDAALDAVEDRLLALAGTPSGWTTLKLHETDLAGGLSEAELASLAGHLSPASYPAGAFLCRAGEPADRLWLLLRGSVSVRLPGDHHSVRIAGLGPGTAVGELGLLDRRPRSADVSADRDVETLVLSAASFDAILRDEPHLGQSLLATIARLTAERLRATSAELRLAEL